MLDTSGNNLHGTPVDEPIYRSVPYGGLGLEFDGVDSRVTIADNPLFQLTHSLTLEATIRLDALAVNAQPIVLRMDDRSGLDPFVLRVTSDGYADFTFRSEDNTRTSLTSNDFVPLGEFVHIAGTLDDATGSMKIFIDGRLSAELTTNLRPIGELDPTRRPGVGIGSWSYEAQNVFDGVIDEVRIWDEARAVPEPSTITLFTMAGLVGAFVAWRKRRRT